MHMSMTGSNGVLSVPSEHLPGLIALVATPLVLWALVALVHRASGRGRPWARRSAQQLEALPFSGKVAAVAMVIGATVHAAIVPTHWADNQVLAVLFALDTLGFLAATWWTVTGRRHWPPVSAAMLGGTVAGYAFYLVRGWETPDPVGMLTSTAELAGCFVVVLAGHAVFADPERRRRMTVASVGGALAILLGTVVATGSASSSPASAAPTRSGGQSSSMGSMPTRAAPSNSATSTTMPAMSGGSSAGQGATTEPTQPGMPAMSPTEPGGSAPSTSTPASMLPMGATGAGGTTPNGSGSAAMGGMGSGGSAPSGALALATTSPAGNITWPLPMGAMGPGMQMVTPDCTTEPTTAQQQVAVSLVDQTVTAVSKYQSLDVAKAAGYIPVTPSGMPMVHYANPAYLRTPQTLQPRAVESLVYANTAHGAVLVAAMYAMGNGQMGATPPMPGGCLTEWHVHTNLCFSNVTGTVVGAERGGVCPAGSTNRVTQPMLHVWLAPVPGGPLTVDAPNPQVLAAAAQLPVPVPPNPTA